MEIQRWTGLPEAVEWGKRWGHGTNEGKDKGRHYCIQKNAQSWGNIGLVLRTESYPIVHSLQVMIVGVIKIKSFQN